MAAKISFLPVGNGDMTLITLADEVRILIDCNIRDAADDPDHIARDVAKDLRKRILRDDKKRPYVDVFALSHPDQDHCNGLVEHFYLGSPDDYPDDKKPDAEKKILIREIWSSPMVFRRRCKDHVLCDDAIAFNSEAKRRVKLNKEKQFKSIGDGNSILILGEDEGEKTKDLAPILVKVDTTFDRVNWVRSKCFSATLLAPMPKGDDETEKLLSKNHSSVILNMSISAEATGGGKKKFLSAGDAEVAIWERLWTKHKKDLAVLTYDLLQTPHHNSWHSLSWDSWSGKNPKVSAEAKSALAQINTKGVIVSSSDPIDDDDVDPPCHGAKVEYVEIASAKEGTFYCTGEYPKRDATEPLEFSIENGKLDVITNGRTGGSLLRSAVPAGGLSFPDKPVVPNKSSGFA
ncbi:metallohydrolase [Polaromonas sp. LjRoot131]|uniref:metallohydrolase n=1 Tax=Polaromonas sp. LjRoot131 TaxID=3342262 RepID=UPI003ED140FB